MAAIDELRSDPVDSSGARRRRSFLTRVMAIAFLATHVPLITLAIFVALRPQPSPAATVGLVLAATLVGTAVLLTVLARWLGPLQTATDRLHHFLTTDELEVGGPYPPSELGTLLEDIDLVSTRLAAQRDAAVADAAFDIVSGASSRRAAEAILRGLGTSEQAGDGPVSVVVADLDDFKGVNDRHGHPFGDLALHLVAGTLRELRSVELVARWGGDEFLVLVRAEPGETAQAIDRARHLIAERTVAAGGRVTVSAGVAPVAPGTSVDAAIDAADAACYRAKAEGRDRVLSAPVD